jgi:magnesium transporter
VIVECAVYEDGARRDGDVPLDQACEAAGDDGAFVWVDLYEPTPEEFEALRDEFSLHPLAIEDATEAHERPKLERYEGVLFMVLKTVTYDDETEDLTFGEIMVFRGPSFVITVRHGAAQEFDDVKTRFAEEPARLQHGTAGILHAVVDKVVDEYEPVVDGLQQDIDEVEVGLFGAEGNGSTQRIYRLGREVLEFSRAVRPLVEPVRALAADDRIEIADELRTYFRDIEDHIERVDAWVSAQRELLSNLLQANLTQVTIQQNEDMRKISAYVAIVAVPTAIAGIYGMNFEHMPELSWRFGYPAALLLILVLCAALYWRLKRSGWL